MGLTVQVWHTCIWEVSPILLCRSCQALSGWMGNVTVHLFSALQRCLIGFMSGLWLGHSRTFRELSRRHSCVVLAVCLGSLSCWRVNLSHPDLFHLSCACLHSPPGVAHLPHYPQCIYTCVLCLSVVISFSFIKPTSVFPVLLSFSSSSFLVFLVFDHSACPDTEPSCRSLPCHTTLDY